MDKKHHHILRYIGKKTYLCKICNKKFREMDDNGLSLYKRILEIKKERDKYISIHKLLKIKCMKIK